MKYQFLVLVFVSLLFSCETEVKKEKIDPVDWSARTAEMNDSDSLEYGKSYLSIYSQVYSVSALKTQNLAAMVSLRNTSDTESIFILSTKYYDTRGELVKSYFDNPIYLNPLETVEILINEVDVSEEVILRDQKRVVVDTIVRYEIKDPLKFFQTTRTELALIDRLGRIINSSVRGVISQYYLIDLLSETRNKIMAEILENVKEDEGNFGIEIVDLRLKRTELTNEVQGNVFDRMRTEREREANLLRAEGQEISQKIKATADREKIEIVAEAEKQSNILRGTGEAARNKILNDAFAEDPEFFE